MKTETLKLIYQALENTVSKDITQFGITFLRLEKLDNESLKIVGTNGHILSSVITSDEEAVENIPWLPDGVAYVSSDRLSVIRHIKMILSEYRKCEEFPTSLLLSGIGLSSSGIFADDAIPYPDYKQVMPKIETAHHTVAINASLLKQLADAIQPADGPKNAGLVVLRFPKNKRGAIEVLPYCDHDSKNVGVLMPLRLEE